MAFSHDDEKKGISLPGLIDIVFLLLIFSLVTLSVSNAPISERTAGEKEIHFNLPKTASQSTSDAGTVLRTLCFQIEYLDAESSGGPKVAYALWPSVRDSITVEEARFRAQQDSLKMAVIPEGIVSMNPQDFERTDFCRMISRNIEEYKARYFNEPRQENSIEIRAERDTEFGLINYILVYAGAFGDTIPSFVVRTLSGREVGHGVQR